MRSNRILVASAATSLIALYGCGNSGDNDGPDPSEMTHTLVVARNGSLSSFALASGAERAGSLTDVTGPVNLQILEDGTALINLTGRNEILAVDLHTMLEVKRIPSSGTTGTRPVHSYISPSYGGKRYWVSLNDGDGSAPTNTARFLDITSGSTSFLEPVGEVPLGIGHHKLAFSRTRQRAVISNIGDCVNVMSAYDFSNMSSIATIATMDAAAAGFDGAGQPRCDPDFQNGGFPPAPHGCATSPLSGKIYCSLTATGDAAVIDIDAATPTFKRLPTNGTGGGYTFVHPGGRYIYQLQETPREGDGGSACVIGQVVVIDSMTDTVVAQRPVAYTGPACTTALAGKPEASANPGHGYFSKNGNTLFVPLSGGFMDTSARVNQLVALDTTDPAAPVQLPSIAIGLGTDHGTGALEGTGQHFYVVNQVDGTVSEIDVASRAVTRTLSVGAEPAEVATFGTSEGPSDHTGPVE
jgi:YVTN family beta-propeller protein